ncbi:TonB-dependent receptor [Nitrosomonas sp. Is37]|uniref:TonB-dependent receptor family protein n=1 Tax=Nitrosomonas sp. Is37 TaxID=3080535 RepID=UPI00294ABB91|nr:TonB-dependent receptor [Nitrosomonas sp. Is37]MDV6344261.1 TonB-dependent receptor [Nitrosomonas sp. Is37]
MIGFFITPVLAQAQQLKIPEPVIFAPLTVTATRTEKKPEQIPDAITRIERSKYTDHQPGATLDEFAYGTPGVFFQNQYNFTQDLRIAIRGFGARSPFGVRGIQLRVDDIPQTLPDGQTQLDAIDPALIERMEILRGPSTTLYGNASGGMISITTRSPREKFEVAPRLVFGQFGYLKSELYTGGRMRNFDYGLFGSYLQQKGWRNHSSMENLFSQVKLNFQSSPDSDWMILLHEFYSPDSKDPGALTLAEVNANPKQAAANNQLYNAGEAIRQEQFAVRYRKSPSSNQILTIVAHALHRDFQNLLPFNIGGQVEFDRWTGGLAAQFASDHTLLKRANRLLVGVDYAIQNDDRRRFNNLFGVQGALNFDQIERVQNVGSFLRNEWSLTDKFDLVAGGRWDWFQYRVKDVFLLDSDQSGTRTLSQASGTGGLVYRLLDTHQIYTNIASVFEAPTTTELINNPAGTGGFNNNLETQTSLSKEIGLRGSPAGFAYEATFFHIHTRNEITPFELAESPGRIFFRNAGKSRRLGVESRLATPVWQGLQGEIAYTYSDFEFERFIVDNIDLKGNEFPGLPKHRWEGRIRYTHPTGIFGQLHVHRVGEFFVNDINTVTNHAYTLGQLLLGWEKKHRWLEGSVFVGINNLFDERYNANTRINAAFGRFFEPGPPLNVFGGLRIRMIPF